MNWKREAADKLRDHAARKLSLTLLEMEIRDLKEQLRSIRSSSADGTPVKGGGNAREDRLLNNISKRQELEYNLKVTRRTVDLVEKALRDLSAQDRMVLERIYIHPAKGSVDRLCEELNVERATVYRYREQALRSFTMRMYGLTET